MKINYIGIVRDHSASMGSLAKAAQDDFNQNLAAIKQMSEENRIPTFLTVVECGVGFNALVNLREVKVPVESVNPIYSYLANGTGTPLFDSVGKIITTFEERIFQIIKDDSDTSFLVLVVTDGEENRSILWNAPKLRKKIQELQDTGKWTFAFRVPHGYGKKLSSSFGISSDNILEWETTTKGLEESSRATTQAYSTYYKDRSRGATATNKFFTNLSHVDKEQLRLSLTDITNQVQVFTVTNTYDSIIRDFIERMTSRAYVPGTAFYELVKPEKIQDHKEIIIQDKSAVVTYSGFEARRLLGLPDYGEVKVTPGNHGDYRIFVQSKSVNRILSVGSRVIYWEKAL